MLALDGRGKATEGGFGHGVKEPADQVLGSGFGAGKMEYVKPMLATHGSVQQLTEGGHKSDHGSRDSGSNISFKPDSIGGNLFGDW